MKPENTLFEITQYIKENELISNNDNCLICVSGGFDSTFLFDVFLKIALIFNFRFSVAHVNYQLRGKESEQEQEFVKKLAHKNKIKFHLKSINLKNQLKNKSLENEARKVRYDFFYKIAQKYNYNKIVTAHNSNDQAETILLKLIRGTSLNGLKGIVPKRNLNLNDKKIELIRPLLFLTREQIEYHCQLNKLNPKTDNSNFSEEFTRNRIRNKIIPLIIKENPQFLESINKTSKIISEENDFLERYSKIKYEDCFIKRKENYLILSYRKIKDLENWLIKRIIKIGYQKLRNDHNSFSYIHLEMILNIIIKNISNKKVELPKNHFFTKDKDSLILSKGKIDSNIPKKEYLINKLGIHKFPNFTIKIEKLNNEYNLKKSKDTIYLDSDRLDLEFKVTNIMNNINFIPFGKNKKYNLKSYLNKKNVSKIDQKDLLLLFNKEKLLWVIGLERINDYLINKKTKNILAISYKEII